MKDLLNIKVLIPIISHTCLSSLDGASSAIEPLFLAMPIDIGGLGLPPREVGYILGTVDILNVIFQVVMFGRLVGRFGVKTIFLAAISAFIPIYALLPLMNLIVRRNGLSYMVWVVLGCQLSACSVMQLGYGA